MLHSITCLLKRMCHAANLIEWCRNLTFYFCSAWLSLWTRHVMEVYMDGGFVGKLTHLQLIEKHSTQNFSKDLVENLWRRNTGWETRKRKKSRDEDRRQRKEDREWWWYRSIPSCSRFNLIIRKSNKISHLRWKNKYTKFCFLPNKQILGKNIFNLQKSRHTALEGAQISIFSKWVPVIFKQALAETPTVLVAKKQTHINKQPWCTQLLDLNTQYLLCHYTGPLLIHTTTTSTHPTPHNAKDWQFSH